MGASKISDIDRLIEELKIAIASDDRDKESTLYSRIVQHGCSATPALTSAALEFDPHNMQDDCDDLKFLVARCALWMIRDIGELSEEDAQALFVRFVRGVSGGQAQRESWGGVWSAAVETLQSLGYKVVE